MSEFDPVKYKAMVKEHQEKDRPLAWFDSIYTDAKGDYRAVFWADLAPSPYLVSWLEKNPANKQRKKAVVIGCGVGDDAEALSSFGYDVTAFDISQEAINLCKGRYKDTKVNYVVENLFEYPAYWMTAYDVVYECNTIQVLPGKYRAQARDAMISLLKKGSKILVSCRSRKKGEQLDDIPLPLDKEEIDSFIECGLKEKSFISYDDTQIPSVPHFFAVYEK